MRKSLLVVGMVAALAGCAGQGSYTRESASAARTRLDQIKSAGEWEMAMQSFLAGDLPKALKRIDTSIALNESVAKSHVLRGRILMEMGNVGSSLDSLTRAVAIDPQHVDAHYFTAVAYERLAQREKALASYLAAAELDRTNAQYVIAAGEMYMDLGRFEEAEAFLREQSTLFVHHAGVKQTLGHLAMLKGEHEAAIALLAEARLLAPDDRVILEDLTRAQFAGGQYAKAESGLAAILRNDTASVRRDLHLMRARCLVQLKRPVDAREILIKLTTGHEGAADVEAWALLGNVSYALSDLGRVRTVSSRLVAVAPDRPEGYLLRGLLMRKQDNLSGALDSADQALARGDKSGAAIMLKGLVLDEMGRLDDARAAYSQALANDPANRALERLIASVDQRLAQAGAFAEVPDSDD